MPSDFFSMNMTAPPAQEEDKNPRKPSFPVGTDIKKVEKAFRQKLRQRFFSTRAVISQVLQRPSEKRTYFNKDELFTIGKSLGLICTDAELDEIFRHFDRDDDGKINYLEFTHDLLKLPRPGSSKYMGIVRGRDGYLSPHSQQIVKRLIVKAERAACPATTLTNIFQVYDGDGSGMIAYDEMEAMVRDTKCDIAETDAAAKLLALFSGGNAELTYDDFARSALGLSPDSLKNERASSTSRIGTADVVHKISAGIKERLLWDPDALTRAIKVFDDAADGDLRLAEFSKGLWKLGLPINSKQCKQLFQMFDSNGKGYISIDDFATGIMQLVPVGERKKISSAGTVETIRSVIKSVRAHHQMGDFRAHLGHEFKGDAATKDPLRNKTPPHRVKPITHIGCDLSAMPTPATSLYSHEEVFSRGVPDIDECGQYRDNWGSTCGQYRDNWGSTLGANSTLTGAEDYGATWDIVKDIIRAPSHRSRTRSEHGGLSRRSRTHLGHRHRRIEPLHKTVPALKMSRLAKPLSTHRSSWISTPSTGNLTSKSAFSLTKMRV